MIGSNHGIAPTLSSDFSGCQCKLNISQELCGNALDSEVDVSDAHRPLFIPTDVI